MYNYISVVFFVVKRRLNIDKLQVSGQFLCNFPKLYNKYLSNSGIFVEYFCLLWMYLYSYYKLLYIKYKLMIWHILNYQNLDILKLNSWQIQILFKIKWKYGKYLDYDLKQNDRIKHFYSVQLMHCYWVQFRLVTQKLENETKLTIDTVDKIS